MKIKNLLSISNLNVCLNEKNIINNFNLNISFGEVHVIVGPNGVGKSTLARILAGDNSNYKIDGSIIFNDLNLLSLSQSEIAMNGLFLSFQNPVEIPGVSNLEFFKAFINFKRKFNNVEPLDNVEFFKEVNHYMNLLAIKKELIDRYVNVGFSGGEKKKNEILQMLLLKPDLAILDEVDSGLDVDSLKCVFNCINSFRNSKRSLLIITHYCRIVDYIDIDFVHVLYAGKIIKTGDKSLLYDIDKNGYIPYS